MPLSFALSAERCAIFPVGFPFFPPFSPFVPIVIVVSTNGKITFHVFRSHDTTTIRRNLHLRSIPPTRQISSPSATFCHKYRPSSNFTSEFLSVILTYDGGVRKRGFWGFNPHPLPNAKNQKAGKVIPHTLTIKSIKLDRPIFEKNELRAPSRVETTVIKCPQAPTMGGGKRLWA